MTAVIGLMDEFQIGVDVERFSFDITSSGQVINLDKGDYTMLAVVAQSKTVTFSEPGNYYYICAPHPWMYGQVIVE